MGTEQNADVDMDSFKLHFLEALSDDSVIKKYQEILTPLVAPLKQAMQSAQAEISQLKNEMADKDTMISTLNKRVSDLESRYDDLEQHGRKGSVRFFGVPEKTAGSTNTKILEICNTNMAMDPPITLQDLEVTHRLGKPDNRNAEIDQSSTPPKPRPIIVKFQSRRIKSQVMSARSLLKDNPCEFSNGQIAKIYAQDDLTKRRANLAN